MRVARKFIRGLEIKGQMLQRRVVDHTDQSVQSNLSFADFFMPVPVTSDFILIIVKMNRPEP